MEGEANHIKKKQKYSHLYEKIQRSTPPPGTPPVEEQRYLSQPHTVEVIGVSFSAGQVSEWLTDSLRKGAKLAHIWWLKLVFLIN